MPSFPVGSLACGIFKVRGNFSAYLWEGSRLSQQGCIAAQTFPVSLPNTPAVFAQTLPCDCPFSLSATPCSALRLQVSPCSKVHLES